MSGSLRSACSPIFLIAEIPTAKSIASAACAGQRQVENRPKDLAEFVGPTRAMDQPIDRARFRFIHEVRIAQRAKKENAKPRLNNS
jgi:hypothetical protein